jgi:amino acid transporter
MNTLKPTYNFYLLAGLVFLLLTILFVGVFRDDEFNEPTLFTKYRPTLKMYFHSETGMSDLTINDLSGASKSEEMAFQEFVIKQKQQNNSTAKLSYVPMILIQLTLTFMTFGLYRKQLLRVYKKWHLPLHFSINLVLTTICLSIMLSMDKIYATMLFSFLMLFFNYLTIRILTRKQRNTYAQ